MHKKDQAIKFHAISDIFFELSNDNIFQENKYTCQHFYS